MFKGSDFQSLNEIEIDRRIQKIKNELEGQLQAFGDDIKQKQARCSEKIEELKKENQTLQQQNQKEKQASAFENQVLQKTVETLKNTNQEILQQNLELLQTFRLTEMKNQTLQKELSATKATLRKENAELQMENQRYQQMNEDLKKQSEKLQQYLDLSCLQKISITNRPLSRPIEIGENYERTITIYNNSNQDLVEGTMTLLADGYHEVSITQVGPIRQFDSISIQLKVKVANGTSIDDIPSSVTYLYTIRSQIVIKRVDMNMGKLDFNKRFVLF